MPVRNPVAGTKSTAVGVIKRQLVKLVTEKSMEIVTELAMQSPSHKAILVMIRIGSWTARQPGQVDLTRVHTGDKLLRRQLLQARVAGISDIGKSRPDARNLMAYGQVGDVALRSRKETGATG